MDRAWLIAYGTIAALALVQSLLLALQAWEHRRYARSCMRSLGRLLPTGRAAVFAPCKGLDVALEANLRALLRQDYGDYEVTFIVESPQDPACAVIRRLMAEHPRVATRLLVAGRATDSGQKVHNLRAATAELSPQIQYVAMVDSDARPRPEWLRALIARLDDAGIGATTGYRWFVPQRRSMANWLLYSINCGVMSLLSRKNHYLVWGGSWASRREVFESIGLREAWKGTLSDDLVATRLLRRAGLASRFEPACVVASPMDYGLREMFAFLRRQYLVGRFYARRWWVFGLCTATLGNLAWLASLAAIGSALLTGVPPVWIPLSLCAVLYLLSALRGWARQDLIRTYFPEHAQQLRAAARFDIWAGPLSGLVNWLGMLASTRGEHIVWRGIRYRMAADGQIRAVSRADEPALSPQRDSQESSRQLTPLDEIGVHTKAA